MKKLVVILVVLILSVAGCSKEEEPKKAETKKAPPPIQAPAKKKPRYEIPESEKTLVARVNNTPIYKEDLRGRRLQELINEEILYFEALRRGIDKKPKITKQPEEKRKNLIIMTIKSDIMRALPKPSQITDEEARKYYNDNIKKFTTVIVKRIIAPDKALAEEIHKKVAAGGDFEKIASEYATAGKQVTVNQKSLRKSDKDIFNKLEVGSLSDIRESGDKFEILQISEIRKMPYKKIKRALLHTITAQKNQVIVKEMMEQFKKDNNINIEIIEEG
ncbi:MAG: peptidyl-prolyl cis-trans isomerase [Candidatus Dadabacteria bacterium]|nr:peptidyl-prolyl cis-trans isomerase [Candidatus Dadabacteria bacterium]